MKKIDKYDNYYNYGRSGQLEMFQVTEKLDGANFRFTIDMNGDIIFGSRNVEGINGTAEGGNFSKNENKPFKPYIETVMNALNQTVISASLRGRYTFFMEAMIPHKIKYKEQHGKVYGFAVWDELKQRYVSNWMEFFKALNLPTVKVLSWNSTDPEVWNKLVENDFEVENEDDLSLPVLQVRATKRFRSALDGESPIEGVMLTDFANQVSYKIKTAKFMEIEKTHSPKVKTGSIEEFLNKYATSVRMEGIIRKMQVEDEYDHRNPFVSLLGMMIKDVYEEATPADLYKLFKKLFMKPMADVIRENKDILYDLKEMGN